MDDEKLILDCDYCRCDYCNRRLLDSFILNIYDEHGVYLEVDGQHLHLEVDGEGEGYYIVERIPINNCPMCGRKLSSK